MDETNTNTEVAPEPDDATPPTTSVSRRDFLRRASKEAVSTTVSVIPGARLAQAVLGVDTPPTGTEVSTDGEGNTKPLRLPWWEKVAKWRQERQSHSTDGQIEGQEDKS